MFIFSLAKASLRSFLQAYLERIFKRAAEVFNKKKVPVFEKIKSFVEKALLSRLGNFYFDSCFVLKSLLPKTMNNKITEQEIKHLAMDCLKKIKSDDLYKIRNDAKLRVVNSTKSYNEFK